ncbi:MAG: hypothetical protein V4511_11800 [Bacteroidota bacterium]
MTKKASVINIFNTILLIALLCVIVGQLYVTFIKYEEKFENPIKVTKQDYGNDFISQYGNRYDEIKKMFSKPVRMAYVGEPNEDFPIGCLHYFLTQYYLSPNLILRNNVVRDTIIYNLYTSKQMDAATNFHLNNGWHMIKDFNNGLILLAK